MRYSWSLDRPDPVRIKSRESIAALKEKLAKHALIAIDTETTGLNIIKDTVVFWSLSTGDDRYFLERHDLEEFRPILEDPSKSWIGSQIKYDANILKNSGINLTGDLFCTLTMDRLVDPGRRHGLKEAYQREFNERMSSFAETFYPLDKNGKPKKPTAKRGQPPIQMYQILLDALEENPNKVIDYASMDAWSVFRLFNKLKHQLEEIYTWNNCSLWDVYLWYEVPFTRVLFNMERRGCAINVDYLKGLVPQINKELDNIRSQLSNMAGYLININSTPQIGEFLLKRGNPMHAKTPKGEISVKAEVLRELAAGGEEAAVLILRYKELVKLQSTYIKNLVEALSPSGRVHTTLHQHAADTSRLSSANPPLQNLPRERADYDIRTAFIPTPGNKMIVADYDQLEMYILGHMSQDKGLINQAIMGRDIHTANVELVWGEPYDDVAAAKKNKSDKSERAQRLRELRQFVKVIGFGQEIGRSKTCSKRGNLSGVAI
jgi:DNA polymerase-1